MRSGSFLMETRSQSRSKFYIYVGDRSRCSGDPPRAGGRDLDEVTEDLALFAREVLPVLKKA